MELAEAVLSPASVQHPPGPKQGAREKPGSTATEQCLTAANVPAERKGGGEARLEAQGPARGLAGAGAGHCQVKSSS